jgi:tRNA1Val (adenine37-N6)-methyltransferase
VVQIYQPQSGYCFNSDTLFLYDFIAQFKPQKELLEVGSGSGVLGLLLARDFNIELTQVEKQETFAKYTQKNADVNGLKTDLEHSDFLEFESDKKFDTIVSNPPFYHGGVYQSDDEMRMIARYNEYLPIVPFIQKVTKMLTPRGRFIFCYDPQVLPELFSALSDAKFKVEDIRFVYPKEGKMASLVMIHARKGSKSVMKTHPALFSFIGDNFSDEAAAIYKQTSTHSIKCEIN